MFSRLTQGVTSVLQELSGEERRDDDADPQDGLVPRMLSSPDASLDVSGASEEMLERLAQTEQLVVQLKELIREKDGQLACAEKLLKEEKEQGEAKFTKLKMQAKAKMAALNKQITELKGQEALNSSQSSETSFTLPSGLEDELHKLREKLSQEESSNQSLHEQLRVAEQRIKEKEDEHAEQVRVLQAVVKDKDVRFQEQIQKHEEELLQLNTQASNDAELQQALRDSQRKIEELEESLRSRSEVLEMLQQELNSADQQKQILTAQFRQMEQELAEAHKLREQERHQTALQAEEQIQALRNNLEALEKEKEQTVMALEAKLSQRTSELDQVKASLDESVSKEKEMDAGVEAELTTLRANLEASERQREEVSKKLEVEVERRVAELHLLQEKLDAVEREREEASRSEREELTRLQTELVSLTERLDTEKDVQEAGVQAKQALEKLWKGLHSLGSEDAEVEMVVPEDPAQVLTVLEERLNHLRVEHQDREARMSQIIVTIETLQGQLDRSTAEGEEAGLRIQQLERQLAERQVTDEPLGDQLTDGSVRDLDQAEGTDGQHSEKVLMLEQQLVEQEKELAALRERLALNELQNLTISHQDNSDFQNTENIPSISDSSAALPDLENVSEEDTTLIAVDTETSTMSTSIVSSSADNESSPEVTGMQLESPVELKGASSDEMVTSTDSEVAHSSWTLLEAINQDASQEWPQQIQDLNALHVSTSSWETSEEQVTSTCSMVKVESSSMVIHETVEIQIGQQEANMLNADSSPSHVFAQMLAEEVQKKHSELLHELQQLKDLAAEAQDRVHLLEEELKSLTDVKDEAEARALRYERDLMEAQAKIHKEAEQKTLEKVHEEQLEILQKEADSKDEKIQSLQADLDEIQQKLLEKEGHAQMLGVQLEDRELVCSDLEEKVINMETRVQQFSEEAERANTALLGKTNELDDLQQSLSLKKQEMIELSESMTAKLLQAGEEKFAISSEVKMLKEQMLELEKTWHDQEKVKADKTDFESENLVALRKENENLIAQIATMKADGEQVKRKLQAALVQRKELMKKIAGFEKGAEESKEKVNPEAEVKPEEWEREQELQKLEAQLQETRQVLISKEEALKDLEQKALSQDEALAEAQVEILRLVEEAKALSENGQTISQVQEDNTRLQLQVTSMESDLDALQKKLQEAMDSRKDTLRKAKEKDRHHREQLRQQKEEYSGLLERFEATDEENADLIKRVKELESLVESREPGDTKKLVNVEKLSESTPVNVEKPVSGDWVQEDWVDFTTSDTGINQQGSASDQTPRVTSKNHESVISSLQDLIKSEQAARVDLEIQLQERVASLSLKEAELFELSKELETLRAKEKQIDALSEELDALRNKCEQAEAHAEMLKAEVEEAAAAVKTSISDAESPVVALQAEVDEFKQFLKSKNEEIIDLSQQLSEQSFLLQKMQETVLEKDQLIASLQEGLKSEQERSQKLESEIPQKQDEERDQNVKLQQLQRKLQAALVSRKELLKENQILKEELTNAEKLRSELLEKVTNYEANLSNLSTEKSKLIEEVDRTLLENQSLGATCESLKLAMDGLLNEKETYKRQIDSAREEAEQASRRWEEKLQGMKEEYETLLKSYENVSDEAERVRKVLEAARQERQESASKARAHEVARQEAEKVAADAQKEVDTVKEKMRKFAKTKHQKIMDLEEENEKLREQLEKKGTKEWDSNLQQELEKVQNAFDSLKASFDSLEAERSSLEQETEKLKQQLAQELDKKNNERMNVGFSEEVKEHIVAQQLSPVLIENQKDLVLGSFSKESNLLEQEVQSQPTAMVEKLKEKEEALKAAEVKVKKLQAALEDEKRTRDEQKVLLNAELSSLRQQIQESVDREEKIKEECPKRDTQLQVKASSFEETMGTKDEQESLFNAELSSLKNQLHEFAEREQNLKEECFKKENQLKELRRSLEVEKDDLEERLMNQLAQVNGSIAGYQQEAADSRDRLADLQRELENVQRERDELEIQLTGEKDRTARLEEDKRQAQRERAEAEAEAGKQKELEQKLKSAQRVREGSQSRARQLEELLREKQLEVRQMQKDCIQYQERISVVDREAKALLLSKNEVSNELESAHQEMAKIKEERSRLESELLMYKGKLDVAQSEVKEARAEKAASEELLCRREAELKSEAERTLDEVRYRLGAELKQMEQRLEQAYRDREREEEATLVAKNIADAAQKYAQETQARLDGSLARLAAFSRSMSSLQDDRDRVLDEAKQWENRFHSALQGKESELREAESRAKDLSEQLQKETTQKEQLQSSLERLQKEEERWQLELSEAEKKHKESLNALEKEREDLQQKLTETELCLAQTQSQLTSLEAEAEGLRHRAKALEEAVDKLQSDINQSRADIKERETEERRLCLNLEQLETDLRSSKTLTDTLQAELAVKQKREVELLGEKEHAVTQAVEEARKEADSRAEKAEKQLEERRAIMRDLEERLCKTEEDASQSKARLDNFTKAMGSLQDDRDRVLSQYKQLEERHLQLMMEKDGLIQEAATENNSLKEELRALLAQRDDLNAENAKLDAQLHGYRDELNQVLSMKDSQHKKLLSVELERISALEKEREELQAKMEVLEKEALVKRGPAVEHEILRQSGQVEATHHDAPGAEVEKLKEQLQAARKEISTLRETLASEREEYAAHSKELKELRWEGGILRTETETAEERVAELAKDLLEMEQRFLAEKEAAAQLRAQNQAFGQAMGSLQDTHDEAISELKELRLRMEERHQSGHSSAPPSGPTGEVWSLKNALSALQNDRERMLEQVQMQRNELERLGSGELAKLTKILEDERNKTGEMKKRMTLLLQERDTQLERDRQELEMIKLERSDLQAQAETLRKQTLTTLSERDQQIRQLGAMLEEARSSEPKLLQAHTHRQARIAEDSAPGGPLGHSEDYKAECVLLQKRLDEEMEMRLSVQEQLSTAQDHLKRYRQEEWHSGPRDVHSETAVLIDPAEGTVTRSRSGGPGLIRMFRGAFCSRQRTPLLVSLYLLTIHAVLLLCLGGFL
ncbi:golgin subfamily B member 1 [Clarias gariepinus]|uniref:golgin subfamily B member 1 n=1 Tax=Clarias gariepinus TaxID=13013 RepID=UPI00234D52F3|nr:golgin subfamily B member 1 [Clarias gariepinus]XP_053365114.1 golgin subfamily B member 1 [Clarias gariepinus]